MRATLSFSDLLSVETGGMSLRNSASYELLRKATNPLREAATKIAQRNLHHFEVPSYMRRQHILTSYRAHHDLRSCLRSLLELHNETLNVWSHLLGCMLFIVLLWYVSSAACAAGLPPAAASLERWPLYVFVISALGCLSSSAIYHLCGTANERWFRRLESLDYVGIIGLIVGSCTPVAWYSFGGDHHLERSLYLLAIGLVGAIVMVGSLTGVLNRASDSVRITLFVALALAGVAALLHAAVVHELSDRHVALIFGVTKMGLTYGLGVVIYATQFPESVAPRTAFDRFGSSHQLWHACVLLAAVCHFQTVYTLWRATAEVMAQHVVAAPLAAAYDMREVPGASLHRFEL